MPSARLTCDGSPPHSTDNIQEAIMHSREDGSATPALRSGPPRGTSGATRFVASAMLAIVTALACSEKAPTSSASVAAPPGVRPSDDALAIDIPAPGGVAVQVLARSRFVDDIDATFRLKLEHATEVVHVNDPSDVVMARITVQPGGSFGWHTHHGPAIVSLAAGELSIVHADDCSAQLYTAGQAFVDPGQGHVHVGFNAGTVETVAYVTFLDVPAGQGPTIPAQGPTC
jgi:quercetin dioxygenase-like cupin family protein